MTSYNHRLLFAVSDLNRTLLASVLVAHLAFIPTAIADDRSTGASPVQGTGGMVTMDSSEYLERAAISIFKGEIQQAIEYCNLTLGIDPESHEAFWMRGTCRESLGDYHAAISDFERSIELDPKDWCSHMALAWLLASCPDSSLRDGETAILHATAAGELCEWNDPSVLGALGAAIAETGRCSEAIDCELRAIQLAEQFEDRSYIAEAEQRLLLYRVGFPYRRPKVGLP
jgi:tetratricopeptide (TPR) repeat protein